MFVPGERRFFGPSRFESIGIGDQYETDSGMGGSYRLEFVGMTADGLYRFESLNSDVRTEYVFRKEELHQKLYHIVAEGSHRGDIRFDGRSQGNPGALSYGYVVWQANMLVKSTGCGLGPQFGTNNEAEYLGLIAALRKALDLGVTHASVKGDSQLVIRQMTGEYACNAPNLIAMHRQARDLAGQFVKCSFAWIPREQNAQADGLAECAYRLAPARKGKMLERAQDLIDKEEVTALSDGTFRVHGYLVNLAGPLCECAYFSAHQGRSGCKHILAALIVHLKLQPGNIEVAG